MVTESTSAVSSTGVAQVNLTPEKSAETPASKSDRVQTTQAKYESKRAEAKAADVKVADEKQSEQKKEHQLSVEEAQKVAAEIESHLNEKSQTVIRFNVSLVEAEESNSQFKFQVVERETGKVIRQFPPEDILNVKERISADPPSSGVFVDSQA